MTALLWVALGGAIGSVARHLVSVQVLAWTGPDFPWGTLAVNLIGSFLLAVIAEVGLSSAVTFPPEARLALATGLMGGFTTYSTFSLETFVLMERGSWGLAMANVAGTVIACLAATFAGFFLARWLLTLVEAPPRGML